MYLGIDLGTSSVKCLLIDSNQHVKASASQSLDVSHPYPGWSEQNPRDWIDAIEQCFNVLKYEYPDVFLSIK